MKERVMKFKTKIDWWLHLLFVVWVGFNVWSIASLINNEAGSLMTAIIFTPLSIFLIVPIWLNTYYYLGENELLVKCGLFNIAKIDYRSIISVNKTRSLISSPALSLDRLEITSAAKSGGFNNSVIISPKDKQGFTEQLKIRNKNIEISDVVRPMSQAYKFLMGGILAVVLIGGGLLFILGEREPMVIIQDHSIQIRAMYGLRIPLADINDITLLDQSMREIGAGRRTNGYNGAAWRGHFTAGLLFVLPDSSPTIRIERERGSDIFISFRDNARTEMLYYELAALDTA